MDVSETDDTSTMQSSKDTENSPTENSLCFTAINEILEVLQENVFTNKMSEEELRLFCDQLESLVAFLRNQDIIRNMYNTSSELESKLQNTIWDLHFLIKEVKAVMANIQRIKYQRSLVKNEIKTAKRALHKQKQQEIHEMELVMAVYDKELLKKWHLTKKSTQPHIIETFLHEALGRKEAVGYVCKMAEEKLSNLKNMEREKNNLKFLPSLLNTPSQTPDSSKAIVKAEDFSIFGFKKLS